MTEVTDALLVWLNSFADECGFAPQTAATSIATSAALTKVCALLLSDTLFDASKSDAAHETDDAKADMEHLFAALTIYAKQNLALAPGVSNIARHIDVAALCASGGADADAASAAEASATKVLEMILTCCVLAGGETLKRVRSLSTAVQSALHGVVKANITTLGVSKNKKPPGADDAARAAHGGAGPASGAAGGSGPSTATSATTSHNNGGSAAAAAAAGTTTATTAGSPAADGPQFATASSATAARIADEELRTARQRIDELLAANAALADKSTSLAEQLQTATVEHQRMRDKYKDAVSQSSASSAIETMELKNELARRQRELREATEDLERTKKLLQDVRADHGALEVESDKLRALSKAQEQQLAQLRSQSSASGSDLRSALDDLELMKGKKEELEAMILAALERQRVANDEVGASNRERDATTTRATELEAAVAQLKAAVAAAESARVAAESLVSAKDEVLARAQEIEAALEARIAELVAEAEADAVASTAAAAAAAASAATTAAAATTAPTAADAESARQQLEECHVELRALTEQARKRDVAHAQEKQHHEHAVKNLKDQLQALQKQLGAAKSAAADAAAATAPPPTDSEFAAMQEDLFRALAENADMKTKLAALVAMPGGPPSLSSGAASTLQMTALRDENGQLRRQLVTSADEMKRQHAVVVAALFEAGQRNLQLQTQLLLARGGMVPGGVRRAGVSAAATSSTADEGVSFFERQRRKFSVNALEAIAMASQSAK